MADCMNRVPDICARVGCFGRESLGGGTSGGKDFGTVNRRIFVGDGSDIEGTPMNLVSHLVSEKACGGSEFLFTNFKEEFGKGNKGPGYTMGTHRCAVNPSSREPPDRGCYYPDREPVDPGRSPHSHP
ncbi:hypothetical protein HOY82DRAFT_534459 [Tuber indicum]|nr:hypothetical protein HOY82DRAFT_534459 [Tuber indicum]